MLNRVQASSLYATVHGSATQPRQNHLRLPDERDQTTVAPAENRQPGVNFRNFFPLNQSPSGLEMWRDHRPHNHSSKGT